MNDQAYRLGSMCALRKLASDEPEKKEPSMLPAVAGGAVGMLPTLHGISQRSSIPMPETSNVVSSIEELQKMLQPGDILLTSRPGMSGVKTPASIIGMDPFASHAEAVLEALPGKAPTVVGAHPGIGAAARRARDLPVNRDAIIKRFKNPEHAKAFLENLAKVEAEHAGAPYASGEAAKAGLKTIIPRRLREWFASKPDPATKGTFCSALMGSASPVCLSPGIPANEILPQHIQKSTELGTVASYRAPRTWREKGIELALRAAPWAARGALGAALGYGTYRGLKALLDED